MSSSLTKMLGLNLVTKSVGIKINDNFLFLDNCTWQLILADVCTRCSSPPQGNNLPLLTFRLDTLVLLKVPWGGLEHLVEMYTCTGIYIYRPVFSPAYLREGPRIPSVPICLWSGIGVEPKPLMWILALPKICLSYAFNFDWEEHCRLRYICTCMHVVYHAYKCIHHSFFNMLCVGMTRGGVFLAVDFEQQQNR